MSALAEQVAALKPGDQVTARLNHGWQHMAVPPLTVYRRVPSPERVEELVRDYANAMAGSGWDDRAFLRDFAAALLGGAE